MTQGKCFFQKQILSDSTTSFESQAYLFASFCAFPAIRYTSANSADQNPLKKLKVP